jgi:spore germination protein KB
MFENLFPVLENGLLPVIRAGIPELSFPFSELFMFLMYFKYLQNKKRVKKMTIGAYLFSGVFIIFTNIVILSVLGPLSFVSVIPLLSSIRLIEIGGIIERMDPMFVLVLFTSVFIKMTVYYLAAVLALSQLLKKDFRKMILPIGSIIFAGSFITENYTLQIWIGTEIVNIYIMPIVYVLIPILLIILIYVRRPYLKNN